MGSRPSGEGGKKIFWVNRVTKIVARTIFRLPKFFTESRVTLTSHFRKTDWILHVKMGGGELFLKSIG